MTAQLRALPLDSEPPSRTKLKPRRNRGIVGQVRAAFAPHARLATFIGAVLGGFVPVASWQLAHHEIDLFWPTSFVEACTQWRVLLVLAGLVYSALTVYSWGRLAFRSKPKAVGFVVLLEGVLVGASTPWLNLGALGLLAAVNAIATGATLSEEA